MAIIGEPNLVSNEASQDELKNVTFKVVWQVKSDSTNENFYDLRDAVGVLINDPHPQSTKARAKGISTSLASQGNPNKYLVSIDYGPRNPAGQGEDPSIDPVDMVAKISGDYAKYQKTMDVDLKGKSILNSAFDPFSNGLPYDEVRCTLHAQKNVGAWNAAEASKYIGSVNKSAWQGAAKWSVLYLGGPWEQCWHEEYGVYFSVNHTWEFSTIPLLPKKIQDRGFRELKSGKKVPITGDDGLQVTTPELLDGAGKKLVVPEGAEGDVAKYLNFFNALEKDFSVFDYIFEGVLWSR